MGYNLKIKIHQALRQIRRDEAIGDLKVSAEDTPYDRSKLDVFHILESDD